MSSRRDRRINFLLYQIGWFVCVVGAAQGRGRIAALVAFSLVGVHLALAREPGVELRLILASLALGLLLDSAQAASGRLRFAGADLPWLAPPWVLALWAQLGTVLRGCLSWLAPRRALAALLGAVGGPLAFWSGERMGAATWGEPRWATAVSLAIAWGAALPLLFLLARRLGDGRPAAYRLST